MISLPGPNASNPLDVFPVQRLVKLAPDPLCECPDTRPALHMAVEVAEGPALARKHAEHPSVASRHVHQVLDLERGGYRKAVLDVGVTQPCRTSRNSPSSQSEDGPSGECRFKTHWTHGANDGDLYETPFRQVEHANPTQGSLLG